MVTIYYADGTLVHTCTYPCGENELTITYKADFHPNTPNVGLATSVQNLKFIKSDRIAILSLMTEDLFVKIDSFPKFQMDLANYIDDGNILEIPLISTSVRDVLKNTNIAQLGLTRTRPLNVKKTPFLRGILTSENINTVFSLPSDTATHGVQNENSLISQAWSVSEGVFINLMIVQDSASNILSRELPIGGTSIQYTNHDTTLNADISLTRSSTGALPDAQMCLTTQTYVTFQYADDDSWDPYGIVIPAVYSTWENVADDITLSLNANLQGFLSFPRIYNGRPIKRATQLYRLTLLAKNVTASAWTQEFLRTGNIEVKYQDYVDYTLPSILIDDIVLAVTTNLGINVSFARLPTVYFTSPNGEEFWNTTIADIFDTVANLYGFLLKFGLNSVTFASYSSIFATTPIAVPDYCNERTNGRVSFFKFAVDDASRPTLQYANAPTIMWNNEYLGYKNFQYQQVNTTQLKLHINGAEFLEKMQGDDKTLYCIEATYIADGSDIPINFNLSASEITSNKSNEYASECLGDIILSPAVDETPAFVNPDTHISTRDDIALPSTRLCGWQTAKFSIPFYSNLIDKVLGGDIIRLTIGGEDYLVEDVTCGIEPSQVEITCRKILQ